MNDLLNYIPDTIKDLHRETKRMILEDLSKDEIISALSLQGIGKDYALQIIDNVLNDSRDKKDFFKMLFTAVATIAGGLAINYLSYITAIHIGALLMLVFWGIVVAGVIMLIQAIAINKRRAKY